MGFLNLYQEVLIAISILAMIGGFLIFPFRQSIKFPLLAAPFAGLLLIVLGTSAFYNLLAFTVLKSALIVAVGGILASLLTVIILKPSIRKIEIDLVLIMTVLALIGLVTYLTEYTTLAIGSASFLYMDGTDHLGYSHLADWLNKYTVVIPPIGASEHPYQIWPEYMFTTDPRFGSLFFLSIASLFHQQSGMFSYDFACAVVLSITILGLAAIFAKNRMTFIILAIGLMLSGWFELSRDGFFGKILGFPAMIFIFGLFLQNRPFKPIPLVILIGFTISASCLYPGYCVALVLAIFSAVYLLTECINVFIFKKDNIEKLIEDCAILFILISVAIATLGILPKPSTVLSGKNVLNALPIYNHADVYIIGKWLSQALPHFLQLDHFMLDHLYGFSKHYLTNFTLLTLLSIAICLGVACYQKNQTALVLLLSSLFMVFGFLYFQQAWLGYQLVAIYYPLLLCGAIYLLSDAQIQKNHALKYTLIFAAVLMVFLHYPHFHATINRYASASTPLVSQYQKKDFDNMQKIIGNSVVMVDSPNAIYSLPVLLELLGQRNIALQWNDASWKAFTAYSELPNIKKKAKTNLLLATVDTNQKLLAGCSLLYSTTQYRLLKCGK